MIITALREKLRARGPLGFAADAAKTSAAYWYIAVRAVYIGSGASTVVTIAGELLAREWPHRCDADCASDRTACEERAL